MRAASVSASIDTRSSASVPAGITRGCAPVADRTRLTSPSGTPDSGTSSVQESPTPPMGSGANTQSTRYMSSSRVASIVPRVIARERLGSQ